MEAGIPARLTAAAGRKFGMTVGLAFVAIGGVLWWRGHPLKATVAFSLGGLLVAGGLLVPTLLGPVERAWMGLAHLISKVTTPIFMGIVYFLVMTPMGKLRGIKGSPIRSVRGKSSWHAHETVEPERMERQF